jgi:hypothetical protein
MRHIALNRCIGNHGADGTAGQPDFFCDLLKLVFTSAGDDDMQTFSGKKFGKRGAKPLFGTNSDDNG